MKEVVRFSESEARLKMGIINSGSKWSRKSDAALAGTLCQKEVDDILHV